MQKETIKSLLLGVSFQNGIPKLKPNVHKQFQNAIYRDANSMQAHSVKEHFIWSSKTHTQSMPPPFKCQTGFANMQEA